MKSFFRRRVRRKNTLRGASVAGPIRDRGASAANPPLAEKASAFFDSLQGRRISGGPGCLERRHIFLLSWQAAMVLARRKSWNTDMGKSIPTAMAAARSMVVRP